MRHNDVKGNPFVQQGLATREPWHSPGDFPNAPRGATGVIRKKLSLPTNVANASANANEVFDLSRFVKFAGETFYQLNSNVAVMVLAAPDVWRNGLGFRNSGPTGGPNIYISFGTPATVNSFLRLQPNELALFDDIIPQDDCWAISDLSGAGIAAVTVVQSTIVLPVPNNT